MNHVQIKDTICVQAETEVLIYAKYPMKFNGQDVLSLPDNQKQLNKFATANAMSKVQKVKSCVDS